MIKKRILIVEDDLKTGARLKEMLGKEYRLELVGSKKAVASFEKSIPDLILIDYDLKDKNGLQVFYEIHPLKPEIKIIMLSTSGSIPLAVNAAKSGISDFLRKPLNAEQVKEAVARSIFKPQRKARLPQNVGWLRGESSVLNKMLHGIQETAAKNSDLVLQAEKGIDKRAIAEIIHGYGPQSRRKLVVLNLASFQKEALETSFWTILQDAMVLPDPSSLREEEDRCGTIFLNNFESVDEHFKIVLLKFFRERRGKIDKSIRLIIGVEKSNLKDFACIEIPPLRQRKGDLPYILAFSLKYYSDQHNKTLKHISTQLLEFLMAYDYPGNYAELDRLIQVAVLNSTSNQLEARDLPFNFDQILQGALKKDGSTLEKAKQDFERKLYPLLLQKLEGNQAAVARFLDFPKTAFLQRLEELETNLLE